MDQLPDEIISYIVDQLSEHDIRAFGVVCKALFRVIKKHRLSPFRSEEWKKDRKITAIMKRYGDVLILKSNISTLDFRVRDINDYNIRLSRDAGVTRINPQSQFLITNWKVVLTSDGNTILRKMICGQKIQLSIETHDIFHYSLYLFTAWPIQELPFAEWMKDNYFTVTTNLPEKYYGNLCGCLFPYITSDGYIVVIRTEPNEIFTSDYLIKNNIAFDGQFSTFNGSYIFYVTDGVIVFFQFFEDSFKTFLVHRRGAVECYILDYDAGVGVFYIHFEYSRYHSVYKYSMSEPHLPELLVYIRKHSLSRVFFRYDSGILYIIKRSVMMKKFCMPNVVTEVFFRIESSAASLSLQVPLS